MDVSFIDVHVFTIPDMSTRLECDVVLKADDGTEVVEIGEGTSSFDAPFITPRTLIDLPCIDLSDEDDADDLISSTSDSTSPI